MVLESEKIWDRSQASYAAWLHFQAQANQTTSPDRRRRLEQIADTVFNDYCDLFAQYVAVEKIAAERE